MAYQSLKEEAAATEKDDALRGGTTDTASAGSAFCDHQDQSAKEQMGSEASACTTIDEEGLTKEQLTNLTSIFQHLCGLDRALRDVRPIKGKAAKASVRLVSSDALDCFSSLKSFAASISCVPDDVDARSLTYLAENAAARKEISQAVALAPLVQGVLTELGWREKKQVVFAKLYERLRGNRVSVRGQLRVLDDGYGWDWRAAILSCAMYRIRGYASFARSPAAKVASKYSNSQRLTSA